MVSLWHFWEHRCESGIYAPARTGTLLTTFSGIKKPSKNDVKKTLGNKHIILAKSIENCLKMGSSWPHQFDVFGTQSFHEWRNWPVKGLRAFQMRLKIEKWYPNGLQIVKNVIKKEEKTYAKRKNTLGIVTEISRAFHHVFQQFLKSNLQPNSSRGGPSSKMWYIRCHI